MARNVVRVFLLFLLAYSFLQETSHANSGHSSLRIYEYEVPDRMAVYFRPSSMKKYINLLHKITLENSPIISDQYKKIRFRMMGVYKEKGKEKKFSGKREFHRYTM